MLTLTSNQKRLSVVALKHYRNEIAISSNSSKMTLKEIDTLIKKIKINKEHVLILQLHEKNHFSNAITSLDENFKRRSVSDWSLKEHLQYLQNDKDDLKRIFSKI